MAEARRHEPNPAVRALLVVALPGEAWPLIRRMRGWRRLGRGLVIGRLGGAPVALLRCGVGRENARERTAEALARLSPERLISLGTCGALVDSLLVGSAVQARALLDLDRVPALLPLGLRAVVLATVPRVVASPASREAWAARGAEVCEMEAAGVAEAAGDLPFSALKVVSDLAGGRPSRLWRLPRAVGVSVFQVMAARGVARALVPPLEGWLRAGG